MVHDNKNTDERFDHARLKPNNGGRSLLRRRGGSHDLYHCDVYAVTGSSAELWRIEYGDSALAHRLGEVFDVR